MTRNQYERGRISRNLQNEFDVGRIRVRHQNFSGGYVHGLRSWFPPVRARAQEQFRRENEYTHWRIGV